MTLSLASPTENVSDPEIRYPSLDTTNHATAKLPRSIALGVRQVDEDVAAGGRHLGPMVPPSAS